MLARDVELTELGRKGGQLEETRQWACWARTNRGRDGPLASVSGCAVQRLAEREEVEMPRGSGWCW